MQAPENGLVCQVVEKCNEPDKWNETSSTVMFLYLLKTSINNGYIKASEYKQVVNKAYAGIIQKAKINDNGFIDLYECSSIGIQKDYHTYISQKKEISPFAAFGSFIIGTGVMENR